MGFRLVLISVTLNDREITALSEEI